MQHLKTAAPPAGAISGTGKKEPLLDYATQTPIIKLGSALHLMKERCDTGLAIEVIGRYIRSNKRQDELKPVKERGEFIYKNDSGYFYLLGKVESAEAARLVEERNTYLKK
jgi:hypothetical protein